MPAATSPPPFGTAWNHRPIDELKSDGQLEWSTVDEDAGKKKEREAKKCIFCDFNYKGGPNVIRVHLDCALKPRAIRACKPKEECVDRHAAVVKEAGFLLVFLVIIRVHFFCRPFNEEGRPLNDRNYFL